MPLSPGTALQNGHYVIDALVDVAPNGELYWGTHVVSGTRVFIQVVSLPPNANPTDVSALIVRWQGVAFSPRSPLPNPFQIFSDDQHRLCLVMGSTIGLPWRVVCEYQAPLTPKQSLTRIHTLGEAVLWLQEQGLPAVDLAPNRVWFTETGDRFTLSGMPQALSGLPATPDTNPTSSPVAALSRLFYSFLLGTLLNPTDTDIEAVQRALQAYRPALNLLIMQAIYQGLTTAHPPDLATWLAQLPPEPEANSVSGLVVQGSASPTRVVPAASSPPPRRFKKRYLALAVTAVGSAIAGISLGMVWRIYAKNLPGAVLLEPNQAFPAPNDWSGHIPAAAFEEPFIPAQANPEREQDWAEPDWEDTPPTAILEAPANSSEVFPLTDFETIPGEESAEVWAEDDLDESEPIPPPSEDLPPSPTDESAETVADPPPEPLDNETVETPLEGEETKDSTVPLAPAPSPAIPKAPGE
jgi:hypothetical protein